MRKGLSMTAGADLLLGKHDDARFAYRQSKEREGSHRLDIAMPKVAQWIEESAENPDLEQPTPMSRDLTILAQGYQVPISFL